MSAEIMSATAPATGKGQSRKRRLTTDRVMTIEEAAHFLGCSRWPIYKFISSGKLKSFRLGRVYRVRESDLVKLFH